MAALFLLGCGALQGSVAYGVWHMRNWARIVLICLSALALILAIITFSQDPASRITAILLNWYILRWFAANGEKFS